MALNINVSKNHYYARKAITTDVELNQTYSDSYKGGQTTTANISNNEENRIYLFNSEVPNTDRNTTIDEMYFEFDVNTPIVKKTQNVPTFLVYPIKDLFTITEGTSTPMTGKNMSVFTSILDHEHMLEFEDFDGINKGFGRDEDNKEGERSVLRRFVQQPHNITFGQLKDAYANATEGNNLTNELLDNVYEDSHKLTLGSVPRHGMGNDYYKGQKLYYVFDYKTVESQSYTYPLKMTLQSWKSFGAVREKFSTAETTQQIKNEFEQTYVDAVTPSNTIFNMIHKEHDIYDIKVQTLESVGGDQFPFVVNNFNLTTDDVFTGENSARMHLFWENYSGATVDNASAGTVGYGAHSLANCYGTNTSSAGANSRMGVPQTMYGTIRNIPVQRTLDLVKGTGSAPGTPATANCMPEMEVTFKVKQLPPARRRATTTTTDISRSINFIFANQPPFSEETFWDYASRLNSNLASSVTGYQHMAGVINGDTASGSFTMFDVRKPGSGISTVYTTADRVPEFTSANGALGNSYGVDLPLNEWITMRVRQYQRGGATLVYFPNLPQSSDGLVPNFVLDGASNQNSFGGITNMTMGISNFRNVSSSATNTPLNINNGLGVDLDGNDNDRQVEVLVDGIKLVAFNHRIENNTKGKFTPSNDKITIDSDTFVKVNPSSTWAFDGAATARGSKTASDNYYTFAKTPSPTVLSFGFDNITSLSDTFLQFNDFKSVLGASTSSIENNFIKWGYSKFTGTNALTMGSVQANCINLTQTTDIETSGDLFVDNFSKKGFVKITASGVDSTDWKEGPNPWVSAIIKTVSDDGRTIQVDNPEIFDEPNGDTGGQRYVAFRQADSNSTSTASIDLVWQGKILLD